MISCWEIVLSITDYHPQALTVNHLQPRPLCAATAFTCPVQTMPALVMALGLLAATGALSSPPPPPLPLPPLQQPCAGRWKDAPWCRSAGPPFAARAEALVSNLTKREKAGLILMIDLGVPRLDIAPYIWWSEALHGAIAPFQHHGKKPATCWPEPIGVGSSFNATLFRSLGELTSTEGRGLQGGMGHTYWAPNINIDRE